MGKTIFTGPDLNTFCGLDGMGLTAVGQHVTPKEAVVACKVVPDPQEGWCRECSEHETPAGSLVRVLGVDEHVWRHTRRGDKYVTVIIDLTPVYESTGPHASWT
ncbi:hypothetical protein HMPREF2909_07305 [Alloscardovia sp. HMSC034E08]|nr:hypothetical protein HMPREF2909_07305 [Alloscardovia sp. HMSC034E08]